MKILSCVQGEQEWLSARVGRVTASEADQLISPTFEMRTGEMPKTYLAQKVAERITGRPLDGFSTFATEEGQLMEQEARAWYAFQTPHKVKQVGFIIADDDRSGCSPDGLLDDDGGLELKAPQPTNHVKYLLDGKLPKDYAVQVHFSMFVTSRPWWTFVSYRRKFAPFVLRVERDEEKIGVIRHVLDDFYKKFDAALAKLNPA